MSYRAIIDIGTNTAHLLVGKIDASGQLHVLDKKRHYTFLGEEGLEVIGAKAIERLNMALEDFRTITLQYGIKSVLIIATEGLRTASNKRDITRLFTEVYRWPYKIITGDEEATYIYTGALQALETKISSHLVMDIGGGSVEFILARDSKIIYQKSHPIGISRLYEQFHVLDPIDQQNIDSMYQHLDEELELLWNLTASFPISPMLIGCAGTFEVLLNHADMRDPKLRSRKVKSALLFDLMDQVIDKTIDERKMVSDLPPERANYIVVALLLMNYVIKRLDCTELIVSKYALKEGAIMDHTLFLAVI